MRSIVLDKKVNNACGICGSKEPFIEYREEDGIHFIWCRKCNTINFFKEVKSEQQNFIENRMRNYMKK